MELKPHFYSPSLCLCIMTTCTFLEKLSEFEVLHCVDQLSGSAIKTRKLFCSYVNKQFSQLQFYECYCIF